MRKYTHVYCKVLKGTQRSMRTIHMQNGYIDANGPCKPPHAQGNNTSRGTHHLLCSLLRCSQHVFHDPVHYLLHPRLLPSCGKRTERRDCVSLTSNLASLATKANFQQLHIRVGTCAFSRQPCAEQLSLEQRNFTTSILAVRHHCCISVSSHACVCTCAFMCIYGVYVFTCVSIYMCVRVCVCVCVCGSS